MKGENIVSNKYRVVVDGTAYTVEVESLGAGAAMPAMPAAPVATPSAPAPAAAPAPAPAPAAPAAPAEGSQVTAPMPGKILNVKVNVGDSVKEGDLVLLLEAMKMENEVFASATGKVVQIPVKSGDSVNTGDVLMVIA